MNETATEVDAEVAARVERELQARVAAGLAEIKAGMPETYRAIQARAASVDGTFQLVRRALRGEPNCWYAIERGRVMGTPFNLGGVMDEVAGYMVRWGCTYVCIWPDDRKGNDGAD